MPKIIIYMYLLKLSFLPTVYLFIYFSIHIDNQKMKKINVHSLAVRSKWPTQGQAI